MNYNTTYNQNRELRYKINYVDADGKNKSIVVTGKDKAEKYATAYKEKGYKVTTTKLYPFSTNKNQHNFMLVKNRCYNTMYDMDTGNIPYDKAEYNKLYELSQKADEFFGLPLPIAWLDWKTVREAKKIAQMAVDYRMETCIKNGRYDLLQYC
jgi:hypothetical protein